MKGNGDFSIGSKLWPGTSKLIEEMGELQQVLGKLIATHGDTEHWSGDLRSKMIEEAADVNAALQFFVVENFTRDELCQIAERCERKKELFRKWHVVELSRRLSRFEAASVCETESGYYCIFCRSAVTTEDGTDPIIHPPSCPMYAEPQE